MTQGCPFVLKYEDITAQMKQHLTCMTCNVMRGDHMTAAVKIKLDKERQNGTSKWQELLIHYYILLLLLLLLLLYIIKKCFRAELLAQALKVLCEAVQC